MGIGPISLDQVGVAQTLPVPAGKAPMTTWHVSTGGQVATALLCIRRLGRQTAFVSTVGDDEAATQVLAPLAAAGVDTSRVRTVRGAATQRAMIWVDAGSGERTVLWQRDTALTLSGADAPLALVAEAGLLLIDGGDPEASLPAAREAREHGVPVVMDADGDGPAVDELLALSDFPIVSGDWASQRWGSAESAVHALAAQGATLAVVTQGRHGAVAAGAATPLLHAPALRIQPVDTTGAGDAFHGAFCDAVLGGAGAEEALRFSNAVAGLNCLHLGAQAGLPTRQTVESALEADVQA